MSVLDLLFTPVETVEREVTRIATNVTVNRVTAIESMEPIATLLKEANAVASTVDHATAPNGSIGSLFPPTSSAGGILSLINQGALALEQLTTPGSKMVVDITHFAVNYIVTESVNQILAHPIDSISRISLINYLFNPVGEIEKEITRVATDAALQKINEVESKQPIAALLKEINIMASEVENATAIDSPIWSKLVPNTSAGQIVEQINHGASMVEQLTEPNSKMVADLTHTEMDYIISKTTAQIVGNPFDFIAHLLA